MEVLNYEIHGLWVSHSAVSAVVSRRPALGGVCVYRTLVGDNLFKC